MTMTYAEKVVTERRAAEIAKFTANPALAAALWEQAKEKLAVIAAREPSISRDLVPSKDIEIERP